MGNGTVSLSEEKQVVLAITEKTFADIILNFLGKKQKLSFYSENEYFKLGRNDIEQFYYLLNHKIEKEHHAFIEYFSVSIDYNDNTKCEIIGIDAFNKYAEIRDVTPKSVALTWNIIFNFPNAPTMENQKIELLFNLIDDENSEVILNIEHTNQAWGIEVLNLFQYHLKSLTIEKEKKYYIF